MKTETARAVMITLPLSLGVSFATAPSLLAQGTWQTGAPMPGASYGLGAEFVNGKLYAISGFATNRCRLRSAD